MVNIENNNKQPTFINILKSNIITQSFGKQKTVLFVCLIYHMNDA